MHKRNSESGAYGVIELTVIIAILFLVTWGAMTFLAQSTDGFINNVGTFIEDQGNTIGSITPPTP